MLSKMQAPSAKLGTPLGLHRSDIKPIRLMNMAAAATSRTAMVLEVIEVNHMKC